MGINKRRLWKYMFDNTASFLYIREPLKYLCGIDWHVGELQAHSTSIDEKILRLSSCNAPNRKVHHWKRVRAVFLTYHAETTTCMSAYWDVPLLNYPCISIHIVFSTLLWAGCLHVWTFLGKFSTWLSRAKFLFVWVLWKIMIMWGTCTIQTTLKPLNEILDILPFVILAICSNLNSHIAF